jgi:hypothetical protein
LFCERAPRLLEQLRGMTELDDMIGAIAPQLIMRQEEVKPVPEPHFPFLSAVREWAASEDPTIDALYATIEETSGLGERQVQRLCLEYFGGPPTKLKRKFRAIRAAMQIFQGAPLSDVLGPFRRSVAHDQRDQALHRLYADQPARQQRSDAGADARRTRNCTSCPTSSPSRLTFAATRPICNRTESF